MRLNGVLKGHGFSHAVQSQKRIGALAPEGAYFFRGVILSKAKDLLFACPEPKQILRSRKTGATSG
jgi:hypothetical protein